MSIGQVCEEGTKYGASANVADYLADKRHRNGGSNAHKSCWHSNISPDDEYSIFKTASQANWQDEELYRYGLRSPVCELGTDKEIIAKFRPPSAGHSFWHGHPISPRKGRGNLVPKQILKLWHEGKIIDRALHNRLLRQQI